jgi:regulator of nonsense transcripts 2
VIYLLYHLLNRETVNKISALLRRMDWGNHEHIIFKVFYKFLSKSNEIQLRNGCEVLRQLKDYHPSFIQNLLNTLLEEVRIGLDRNDFNDNQHRVWVCIILSNMYVAKIIGTDLIFYLLYMILTYNPEWNFYKRDLLADNPLDSPYDTFRIIMVISIIDICGIHFQGLNKDKLDEFIHFLQIYILSKQYLPLDVENRVTNCLENIYPNFQVYNDFAAALKDSKKFKGFNFEIEGVDNMNLGKKENSEFIRRKICVLMYRWGR